MLRRIRRSSLNGRYLSSSSNAIPNHARVVVIGVINNNKYYKNKYYKNTNYHNIRVV